MQTAGPFRNLLRWQGCRLRALTEAQSEIAGQQDQQPAQPRLQAPQTARARYRSSLEPVKSALRSTLPATNHLSSDMMIAWTQRMPFAVSLPLGTTIGWISSGRWLGQGGKA